MRWPQKRSTSSLSSGYHVLIDGDEFFGEPIYEGSRPCCSPDAVWDADIGGPVVGNHYFSLPNWWVYEDDYYYGYYYDAGYYYPGSENAFLDEIGLLSKYDGGMCVSAVVSENMIDGLPFTAAGSKWQFVTGSLDEYPRVNLSYKSTTGVFKGSMMITVGPYCMDRGPRGPKYQNKKLKVTGAYIDGYFFGAATLKGFSTPIYGE